MGREGGRRPRIGHIKARRRPRIGHIRAREVGEGPVGREDKAVREGP